MSTYHKTIYCICDKTLLEDLPVRRSGDSLDDRGRPELSLLEECAWIICFAAASLNL